MPHCIQIIGEQFFKTIQSINSKGQYYVINHSLPVPRLSLVFKEFLKNEWTHAWIYSNAVLKEWLIELQNEEMVFILKGIIIIGKK